MAKLDFEQPECVLLTTTHTASLLINGISMLILLQRIPVINLLQQIFLFFQLAKQFCILKTSC